MWKNRNCQNPHGEDHSIFMLLLLKKILKFVIAVFVENGGWGSSWALSIATLMIEKYLKNNISNKALEYKMIKGNLLNFE